MLTAQATRHYLASISAFSTDLKRNSIPHRYLLNPLVRQLPGSSASKFEPLLVIWQKTIKGFDCKINSRALSCTALAGLFGKLKHRVPSRQQSLLAMTSSLEKNVLLLLLNLLSLRIKKLLVLCKHRATTNEIFDGIGKKLLSAKAAPIAFLIDAQSFDHSLAVSKNMTYKENLII